MTKRQKRRVKLLVALVALCFVYRFVIRPRQVGDDDLTGMTARQVLQRYGKPSVRFPEPPREELWVYYRGLWGGGTGITLRDQAVVDSEVSDGK